MNPGQVKPNTEQLLFAASPVLSSKINGCLARRQIMSPCGATCTTVDY
jgi:hypothetical protein